MPNLVVTGGQWGDEGKGKVVDLLCPAFDIVTRFNGGNNAGHTVRFADRHFALHLLPSGILHPECRCVIGPGVVIDPVALNEEIRLLESQGVAVRSRLAISRRAHLVLPGHRAIDVSRESSRGAGKLGTTGRGIGPAYESRAARVGVRIGLATTPRRLQDAVATASDELAAQLARYPGAQPPTAEDIEKFVEAAVAVAPMLGDVPAILDRARREGRSILFEGAQGCMLDVDFGTYPYVTSSGCLAGYAAPSCGLPATAIDGVLGVFKAYATRVGSGPFPTELQDSTGEHLRRRGNEFGTTTGRPRRAGWFDGVAARAAIRLSGIEAIALTKLDVLDELDELQVAVGYELDGATTTEFPDDTEALATVLPIMETLPGWRSETSGLTEFDQLPGRARSYVERLESLLGIPVVLASTGPRREETAVRFGPPLSRWLPASFAPSRK